MFPEAEIVRITSSYFICVCMEYGMEWNDLIWYGMVYGMIRYGMVWYLV